LSIGISSCVLGILSADKNHSDNHRHRAVRESQRAAKLGAERGVPIGFHLVDLRFGDVDDPSDRRFLGSLPTSLNLDDASIDRARRRGRAAA